MARKKKVKEPLKLWELSLEEVQKMYDRAAQFPESRLAKIYKQELERSDRSKPQNLDDMYE